MYSTNGDVAWPSEINEPAYIVPIYPKALQDVQSRSLVTSQTLALVSLWLGAADSRDAIFGMIIMFEIDFGMRLKFLRRVECMSIGVLRKGYFFFYVVTEAISQCGRQNMAKY